MAVGAIAARANAHIDADVALGTWIQLHTGNPGSAGTSNVAGNSVRKQATFPAASGGSAAINADLTWTNVSTSETYSFFSMWSASSGGTCLRVGTLSGSAVTAGDDVRIASGALSIGETPAS